jgi:hypothetical protein
LRGVQAQSASVASLDIHASGILPAMQQHKLVVGSWLQKEDDERVSLHGVRTGYGLALHGGYEGGD